MVWLQFAATRSQRAATTCLFFTGSALIVVAAARLSYANVEPQSAKAAERRQVLEAFFSLSFTVSLRDPRSTLT
jgi:hypothetical protein